MNSLRPSDVFALEEMIEVLKEEARAAAVDCGRTAGGGYDLDGRFEEINRMSPEKIVEEYRNRLKGYASGRGF